MYRGRKRLLDITVICSSALVFSLCIPGLSKGLSPAGIAAAGALAFVLITEGAAWLRRGVDGLIRERVFRKGNSRIIMDFIDRLRSCFTLNDLVRTFKEILEYRGDCTILMIDMARGAPIYTSPSTIGDDPEILRELIRRYGSSKNGIWFFSDSFDLLSDHRRARGFFLVEGQTFVFFFMLSVRSLDADVFPQLRGEFSSFLKRNETIDRMFNIAAIAKEWAMVAQTQRSFLPATLPSGEGLELASLYRPLVNVSGDFYDAQALDDHRTLMVVGDVSGKGLSAALIMGVVINTIRSIDRKDDLSLLVHSVDGAIKGMRLEDKYTVLFLGIVDTQDMTIRYVNASMADPLIVSETRAGRQLRHLESNCGILGIVELDHFTVEEAKIFPGDTILVCSDGVTDAADPQGRMLGDLDVWIDFVTQQSALAPGAFVDALSSLVDRHADSHALRDDITALVAKVTV